MKIIARVENERLVEMSRWGDEEIPAGWVDITSSPGAKKGLPYINGAVVLPPDDESEWEWDGSQWVDITPEPPTADELYDQHIDRNKPLKVLAKILFDMVTPLRAELNLPVIDVDTYKQRIKDELQS